jgi:hypothetical protein
MNNTMKAAVVCMSMYHYSIPLQQQDGGSIANINADGTFTHDVVLEEEDE